MMDSSLERGLHLTESETKYFGDLYTMCCDLSGQVTLEKALELFHSAHKPPSSTYPPPPSDAVRQVLQLAQIPDASESQSTTVFLSRKQFYTCLKLIAAHQAALPLRPELLLSSTSAPTLPLPRFTWIEQSSSTSGNSHQQFSRELTKGDGDEDGESHSSTSSSEGAIENNGPPSPFSSKSLANSSHHHRRDKSPDLIELTSSSVRPVPGAVNDIESQNVASSDQQPSTDSEVEQNDDSSAVEEPPTRSKRRIGTNGSPEVWSTASDSPTPTNSVAERPWVKGNTLLWQGLLCEEQRQLLGTEEESSDRHSSDDDNNENGTGGEGAGAGGLDLESIYQISAEQREYYTKQFRTVQPDANGLVSGQVARVFFEKSRIPIEELRHIWQICDVTKDGALSLEEFTAAMHLVVLRRNNIQLPEKLPSCLFPDRIKQKPEATKQAVTTISVLPEADLLHLGDDDDVVDNTSIPIESTASEITQATAEEDTNAEKNPAAFYVPKTQQPADDQPPDSLKWAGGKPAVVTSSNLTQSRDWNTANSKEWTKFNESPTSNVSSPVPKPANFDMQRTAQAVVSDPQILHPVPLRVTPIGSEQPVDLPQRETASPKGQTTVPPAYHQNELRSIQRPQAKKQLLLAANKNLGAIPPPPQRESNAMNMSMDSAAFLNGGSGADGDHPPPPPPLPPPRQTQQHRHARSSSLDLNRLKLSNGQHLPPRVSPQMLAQLSCDAQMESTTTFADFTQFPEPIQEQQEQAPVAVAKKNATTRPAIPSQRVSAFEVYRKPTNCGSDYETKMAHLQDMLKQLNLSIVPASPAVVVQQNSGKEATADTVRQLREQNLLLVHLCSDLSEELYAVHQKKEEMRLRLENAASNV